MSAFISDQRPADAQAGQCARMTDLYTVSLRTGQQRWLERCLLKSHNAFRYSRRRNMAVELACKKTGPVRGSNWKPTLINSLTDRGTGNGFSARRPAFLASASWASQAAEHFIWRASFSGQSMMGAMIPLCSRIFGGSNSNCRNTGTWRPLRSAK
jgi:hypothetical protein